MTRTYELELKGILHGDTEVLNRFTQGFNRALRAEYFKIRRKPFIVVRAAGSHGVDLVAIRNDISFPVEVKSTSERHVRLSRNRRVKAQMKWLQGVCMAAGVFPVYAVRLKRVIRDDPWRVFSVSIGKVEGRARIVYNMLPKLTMTDQGNPILKWEEGLPLHKFIDYLC